MGGLKADQDSSMAMPPSLVLQTEEEQRAYLNIMNRIRPILKGIIAKVEHYFFSTMDCVRDDLHELGLRYTYVDYFSSISCGDLFVPRCHTDTDATLCIVVAVGSCEDGGQWAHPACGWAHAVHAGDIMLINPAHGHCTAVIRDACASRKMIALFLSDNVFKACHVSAAVAEREGLQEWLPARVRSQKRKRK
jgi:hypothetical protein